jgi:hypothetical protein
MIGYILLGILFLIIIIAVVVFFLLSPQSPAEVLVTGPFNLNTKTQLVGSDSFALSSASTSFLNDAKGTFQAYIYLDTLQKTGQSVDCGTRPNQPSCSSGLYEPCKCTTEYDCTNCGHEGYKRLLSLYGVYTFEILNIPDASRQNSVSAQLVLRTKNNTNGAFESFVETVALPPLPLQKWILLTLTKDSRQVNVYYNTSLVASYKALHMITTTNVTGVVVEGGDQGLSGSAGVIRMLPQKLSLADIGNYYTDSSDTRGSPNAFLIQPNVFNSNIQTATKGSFFQSLCLDLSCFSLPKVQAAAPNLDIFKESSSSLKNISNIYDVNTQYS